MIRDGGLTGEAVIVLQEPVAGVRGRNVVAVVGGYRLPLREHIAGHQELPRLQSEAARHVGCGQGPRRRRRLHDGVAL